MQHLNVRSKKKRLLFGLGLGVLILAGCVMPYPQDMRPTLTVSVAEMRPTPTGFTASIAGATPPPPDTGIGGSEALPPSELSGGSPFYGVIFVGAENFLNVRSEPGVEAEIVATLEPNATNLKLTGATEEAGGDRWAEIQLEEDETGWVSSLYLTQQVPGEAFCTNARIRTLARDLVEILQSEDAARFAGLINPQRGLFARSDLFGYEVSLPPVSALEALTSTEPLLWGLDPETGEAVTATFKAFVLDPLEEIAAGEYQQGCNTLTPGVSLGSGLDQATWPYELTNLNYLTLYQPAPPDRPNAWRTWALGVEILDGTPFLTYLIQYRPQP